MRSRFGHAGQLDRGSERWTVTRSAGDWTSSSAPTPGVGKAHHATAITLRAWSLPRFRPRIPPQRLGCPRRPPHMVWGKLTMSLPDLRSTWLATAISSEDPSSSVDVAYTERAHGRALVRAKGTCAYGTVAGTLARARGTCGEPPPQRSGGRAPPRRIGCGGTAGAWSTRAAPRGAAPREQRDGDRHEGRDDLVDGRTQRARAATDHDAHREYSALIPLLQRQVLCVDTTASTPSTLR